MAPEGAKMRSSILMIAAMAVLAAGLMIFSGCGDEDRSPTYEAEKALFDARRYASELTFPTLNVEFLNRTLTAYRKIIDDYSGDAESIEGMGLILVTAQMELAELEFRASMFEDARKDFLHVYEIAGNVPAARANALWSAAYISRETGDIEKALELFSKFHEEYLSGDQIIDTARFNRRYILTPLRIAELCRAITDLACAKKWLGEAEKIYSHIIRSNASGEIKKEARYNLVSTYLLSEEWVKARETIREMRKIYEDQADIPSLLFLEARIELDGFGDRERAVSVFDKITTAHPRSKEAPTALLMKGNILLEDKKYDDAAAAYDRVLEEYGGSGPEEVEARWQLAILEESRNNWIEASLHYKAVYTSFPTTIQGMEAPLRVAAHYRKTGESEALEAAYERAAEHYDRLSSMQYSEMVRIVAEEYHVRTLVEQERWKEAASRLLALPDRYPQYHKFKENYLMAAAIYETELDDPDRAAEILQSCASKYPGTSLAAEALKQSERIRGTR
jgi:outer membrane protein assembly factor BamD (BamD/ComL family)